MDLYKISRKRMIREQLLPRGIKDPLVLAAMEKVPRHLFVEEAMQAQAYLDGPLPIGLGQTISQPYIVALMSQLLQAEEGMKVLEIGTGSGYQAAVLYDMGLEVYSVERLRDLFFRTSDLLLKLKYRSIRLKLSDGTEGWAESGPYDRIIVTAGGPEIPAPLVDQLGDSGKMVIPVGKSRRGQNLIRISKDQGQVFEECLHSVAFVDLVGAHGW